MKTLLNFMAVAATVLLLNNAHAYMIDSTDVGELDKLLQVANLANSGDNAEQAFINNYFNPDITSYTKTSENTIYSAQTSFVDGSSDIFAFELPFESGFYLIKNASCKNSTDCENNTALFQNNEAFDWGVLSYDYLTGTTASGGLGMHFGNNEFTISHVVSIGDIIQVAEPATLGLLTLGVVGLVGARRKKTH